MSPQFVTDVQRSTGGGEFRVGRVALPRWRFAISLPVLTGASQTDALGTIMAFFVARKGQWDSFLFAPPSAADAVAHFGSGGWNQAGGQMGVGNGVQTIFPLVRPIGGLNWPYAATEPIQWLDTRNNALFVSVAGIHVTDASYSNLSGFATITLQTAPAMGVAVAAYFDYAYRVRFTSDVVSVEWLAWQLWKGFDVELEQVFE
jgi:uncharacterized protein (TIGR02217 family)